MANEERHPDMAPGEMFRTDTPTASLPLVYVGLATNTITQIIHSSGLCSNGLPAMSSTNGSIAFASSCDLTGGNPDGNVEIFYFDAGTATIKQITNSTSCRSFPSSSIADGSIAFASEPTRNETMPPKSDI